MSTPVGKAGLVAIAFAATALAACEPQVEAPTARRACFHMVPDKAEQIGQRFNRLPGNYESLEFCAAALEAVRVRGGRGEIAGAYQGQFLFHNRRGIYVARRFDGARYMALIRTGDGRLAMPGAVRRQQ